MVLIKRHSGTISDKSPRTGSMKICCGVIRLQLVYFNPTVFELFESAGFTYISIMKSGAGSDGACVYSGSRRVSVKRC